MKNLEEMLVVHDTCDAARCKKVAPNHVVLTHPKWRKPERANLCDGHVGKFTETARANGITVKVSRDGG